MSASPASRAGDPGRPTAALGLLGAVGVLTVAVFVSPLPLASWSLGRGLLGIDEVTADVVAGLVRFWSGPTGAPSPALAESVTLWGRFHLIKAVLSALWLVALVALAARVRRADAGGASGGLAEVVTRVLTKVLGALALVVLVANLQGAAEPLASAASLTQGSVDPALSSEAAQAATELRQGVVRPATTTLLDSFAGYHLVMVGLGGLMVLLAVWGLWRTWRARPAVRSWGRWWSSVGLLAWGLGFALVTVANLSTAMNPAPALAAFLDTLG